MSLKMVAVLSIILLLGFLIQSSDAFGDHSLALLPTTVLLLAIGIISRIHHRTELFQIANFEQLSNVDTGWLLQGRVFEQTNESSTLLMRGLRYKSSSFCPGCHN